MAYGRTPCLFSCRTGEIKRYLKYTVLSLLLCPLSSSAAEEWKDVKGESTTKIVESTQQKKQKRVITGVVRDGDTNEPIIGASVWLKNSSVGAVTDIDGKYSITIEEIGRASCRERV